MGLAVGLIDGLSVGVGEVVGDSVGVGEVVVGTVDGEGDDGVGEGDGECE